MINRLRIYVAIGLAYFSVFYMVAALLFLIGLAIVTAYHH